MVDQIISQVRGGHISHCVLNIDFFGDTENTFEATYHRTNYAKWVMDTINQNPHQATFEQFPIDQYEEIKRQLTQKFGKPTKNPKREHSTNVIWSQGATTIELCFGRLRSNGICVISVWP